MFGAGRMSQIRIGQISTAPYGCALFDAHMEPDKADRRHLQAAIGVCASREPQAAKDELRRSL